MKVIIIDDEQAMHLIMKRMLAKIDHVEVVAAFHETKDAFAFSLENEVDVAFIDISMPWENGLYFAKRLRNSGSNMRIVFLTSHKEYALSAFDVYAYDYIVKPLSQERLNKTIARIFSEMQTVETTNTEALIEPLTKREKQILQLICKGLSNKEIADTLQLSEGTVKNHTVNIFAKLQVQNRVQATVIAKEIGIGG